ncbi:hypothetical protein LCGC14_0204950 [marine sediment metagenome]|uniref:Uncharacterized protein n=1 Tax=marine sediment metagenome TaxID=412755 RepID=A0A0F9UYY2_9ZZZZ
MDTWLIAGSSVAGAILGALLAHFYREYRERPILKIDVEKIDRARRPISLPDEVYDVAYPQGTFQKWLDGAVKWQVVRAFDENRFEERQLHDVANLCRRFIDLQEQRKSHISRMLRSLESPQDPPTQEAIFTLSCVRHVWLERFREDIFISYAKDAADVSEKLKSNLEGDLHQMAYSIIGVTRLKDYLEAGFAPDAAANTKIMALPEDPQTPLKPFLMIDLWGENSGRTEVLMKDTALLRIGKKEYHLKGLGDRTSFDVYVGSHFQIKANSVEAMRFSQDPDKTNQSELNELKLLLQDGRDKVRIILGDIRGRRWKTRKFVLRTTVA